MKNSHIFFIFTILFAPRGFSLSDRSFNSIIHPSDITPREETTSLSPPLFWSTPKELNTRADDTTTKKAMALKFARRTGITGLVGVALYAMQKDCREFSKDETTSNGVVCIGGTISTALAVAAELGASYSFYWELTRGAVLVGVDYTIGAAVRKYTGGNTALVGPYIRSSVFGAPAPPTRRDIARPYKRAEEHFTSKLGVEVRQIGFWDGSISNDSHSGVVRRDQEGIIPTFGLQFRGKDIHFAYTGETIDGYGKIKIGHGPGPETEENKRRIKARDMNNDINNILLSAQYNRYYFDQGGLDMVIEANTDNGHAGDIEIPGIPGLSGDTFFPGENDNTWIYDQVSCNLGLDDPLEMVDDVTHPEQLDSIGLWFQMFDSEYSGTIAAGAISPFSIDEESIIQYMRPEAGLDVNPACSPTHFK